MGPTLTEWKSPYSNSDHKYILSFLFDSLSYSLDWSFGCYSWKRLFLSLPFISFWQETVRKLFYLFLFFFDRRTFWIICTKIMPSKNSLTTVSFSLCSYFSYIIIIIVVVREKATCPTLISCRLTIFRFCCQYNYAKSPLPTFLWFPSFSFLTLIYYLCTFPFWKLLLGHLPAANHASMVHTNFM